MRGFRSLFLGGLAGKLVGVFRELLLAALYGTGGVAAAYRTAQSGTLIPLNFFTADALSAGFLPTYSRLVKDGDGDAETFYVVMRNALLLVGVFIALAVGVFAPVVVDALGPGLPATYAESAASMLRIMAASTPFYLYTALASYYEMGNGRFFLASIRAPVMSSSLIVGTVAAWILNEPLAIAWSFTTCFVALSVWSAHRVRRIGKADAHHKLVSHTAYRAWLTRMWFVLRPLLPVPIFFQGMLAAERATASLVSTDAVAGVDYARFVTDTAIALVGGPLGLAVLTSVSSMTAAEASRSVQQVLDRILVVFVPASGIAALCAEPLVRVLFARGAFDSDSVAATSAVLVGMAAGLWAQVSAYVLIKALNGVGRNRSVLLAVAAGGTVSIGFNLLLHPMLGPYTLGLACSLGAIVQLALTASLFNVRALVLSTLLRFTPALVLTGGVWWFTFNAVHSTSRLMDIGLMLMVSLVFISVSALDPQLRSRAISLLRRG